jgi:hypothetical protein
MPFQADDEIDSWVIEGGSNKNAPPSPTAKGLGISYNSLIFSSDLNQLRSFTYEEPPNGIASIRFICKDGTASPNLLFKSGGYTEFITHIQKYITLSRSSKGKITYNVYIFVYVLERNLVMVSLNLGEKQFIVRLLIHAKIC